VVRLGLAAWGISGLPLPSWDSERCCSIRCRRGTSLTLSTWKTTEMISKDIFIGAVHSWHFPLEKKHRWYPKIHLARFFPDTFHLKNNRDDIQRYIL
jgi:hypothetical protein